VLLLATAGCSGSDGTTIFVRDTSVVVRSDAAFAQQPDFAPRIESTVAAALEYWGGSWSDLNGKSIEFDSAAHVQCAGVSAAVACYDGDIRVSTQDAGTTLPCVEETALVHEVGHAIIGDPDHTDPRWMDFSTVAAKLRGRQGYGQGRETECPISISMWQHAPSHGS